MDFGQLHVDAGDNLEGRSIADLDLRRYGALVLALRSEEALLLAAAQAVHAADVGPVGVAALGQRNVFCGRSHSPERVNYFNIQSESLTERRLKQRQFGAAAAQKDFSNRFFGKHAEIFREAALNLLGEIVAY